MVYYIVDTRFTEHQTIWWNAAKLLPNQKIYIIYFYKIEIVFTLLNAFTILRMIFHHFKQI